MLIINNHRRVEALHFYIIMIITNFIYIVPFKTKVAKCFTEYNSAQDKRDK